MKFSRPYAAFLLFFWLLTRQAVAQGCASCYTTAAAGGPQTAHALRSGIVLLLIPAVLVFAGIMVVLRLWRTPEAPGTPDPTATLSTIMAARIDLRRR